jgi:transposase
MTYFTGIDVSLRSVSICIVDEHGEVCHETKTAAQPAAIAQSLNSFSADAKSVGLEAGTLTQFLAYGLQAAGFEVICMEARQVKNTLAAMRNKTDRNDARGIAQILRTGWYSRVHVKSMESHRVRALLASRKAILKKCVDLENELRGLLRVFGICLAPRVGHGSFDEEVRQTFAGDEMLACALNPLLTRCRAYHGLVVQGGRGRSESVHILSHGRSALRADAEAFPIWRERQPWPHLTRW